MKIKSILKICYGKDYKHLHNGKYPVLGTGGVIDFVDEYLYSGESILIGRKGTINNPYYINGSFWTVDTLFFTKILSGFPKFIYYLLTTINWLRYNEASGVPSLSANNIKNINIKIPLILEQEKIANFLSLVDNKIELMERKQDILVKYKWGLFQKMFSEKSNLYTSKIGEIFEERSEKGFSDLELLSVTLKNGVIKRSDIESKDNSNINKDNYKHVLPGDIVYNSMRMWQGASGVSEFEGIVSPAYTILKSKNNENSYYFAYYFKTHKMINQFKKYSQGLTSDTWNLKYPLISEISIKIHPLKEQNKIADFLSKIDNKIDSVEQQLEKIKEFKKYLLQQMFV